MKGVLKCVTIEGHKFMKTLAKSYPDVKDFEI